MERIDQSAPIREGTQKVSLAEYLRWEFGPKRDTCSTGRKNETDNSATFQRPLLHTFHHARLLFHIWRYLGTLSTRHLALQISQCSLIEDRNISESEKNRKLDFCTKIWFIVKLVESLGKDNGLAQSIYTYTYIICTRMRAQNANRCAAYAATCTRNRSDAGFFFYLLV